MVDHLSPEARSANMARVRGKNTSPELTVRKIAHRAGFRFRLYRSDLPGTPDLVLPRHRLVVFVHGCFWHRHQGCHRATMPKSKTEFWSNKFDATIVRDRRQIDELERLDWRILTIWECEVKREGYVGRLLKDAVSSGVGNNYPPIPNT